MPVTYPPLNAVLLRRTTTASLSDPDLFRVRENWYDPATRTAALYTPDDSTDPTFYDRPAADIVDRWCEDPGAPPYREIRVHHVEGGGNISLETVDGVTACMVVCTIDLTLTASAVANGRANLTANLAGAQGQVEVSLDGFQTAGLLASGTPLRYVFQDLRPGAYVVSARETRTGGCRAEKGILITAPYGPRFRHDFFDINNAACEIEVLEREYTGDVEVLPDAQVEPVLLDWPGGPTDHLHTNLLKGSQCQLALYLSYDEQLLPLFSGDERLHRVNYKRAGALIWTGYLLPEQYDVAFLAPPTVFNLSATDGLGTLADIPFAGNAGERLRGDWTALQIIQFCLGKLNLDLPLHVLYNLYPSTATLSAGALEQVRVSVDEYYTDKDEPWDCAKVLRALVDVQFARLYQQEGAWWLDRISELSIAPTTYLAYDTEGRRLADVVVEPLVTITSPTEGRPCFIELSQRQNLRPAVARVKVQAEPGEPANLLRFALPRPENPPAVVPPGWSEFGGASQLVYQGKSKTPLLRLAGNTANIITPQAAPWVQLPATSPVPIGSSDGSFAVQPQGGFVTLTFKAKPYGNTPEPTEAFQARMWVAVSIGGVWVRNNGQESNVPLYEMLRFPDASEQTFEMEFGRLAQRITQRQAVIIRLVPPTGGATPCTVDISNLRLTWANDNVGRALSTELDDSYTGTYKEETGQLVSRQDDGLTLFHSDTPQVRHSGTLLDYLGRPVQGWVEPSAPGQAREIGDYLVRDRIRLQEAPAQALSGDLLGQLPGPGALLTDPSETRPAIYAQTSTSHNASRATWSFTGVQVLTLVAPPEELPDGAWLTEDDFGWQADTGQTFILENA